MVSIQMHTLDYLFRLMQGEYIEKNYLLYLFFIDLLYSLWNFMMFAIWKVLKLGALGQNFKRIILF